MVSVLTHNIILVSLAVKPSTITYNKRLKNLRANPKGEEREKKEG